MKNSKSIAAFSILEVTIAIGLIGLIFIILFNALNMFSKQIQNEKNIKDELNNYFIVRSSLWENLDQSDSITVTKNTAILYFENKKIIYSLGRENNLTVLKNNVLTDLHLEMESIKLETKSELTKFICFNIKWKNEIIKLSMPLKNKTDERINNYFCSGAWQK
jgi:hypothetical protein